MFPGSPVYRERSERVFVFVTICYTLVVAVVVV